MTFARRGFRFTILLIFQENAFSVTSSIFLAVLPIHSCSLLSFLSSADSGEYRSCVLGLLVVVPRARSGRDVL